MTQAVLERILLVDDEEDIRTVAELALKTIGKLDVRTCGESPRCIEYALEFSPQIILLDVMMPVMDGPAVLAELRSNDDLKDIPVIFFTAKANPTETEALLELGANAVLNKPFDPMSLANDVKAVWAKLA
jgi:CheY-like chemotaxis protein